MLIHGPAGTGGSSVGSLISKSIYISSEEIILIVYYTDHALDQCLEYLLKMGVPAESIVHLGSTQKATIKTKPPALCCVTVRDKIVHAALRIGRLLIVLARGYKALDCDTLFEHGPTHDSTLAAFHHRYGQGERCRRGQMPSSSFLGVFQHDLLKTGNSRILVIFVRGFKAYCADMA